MEGRRDGGVQDLPECTLEWGGSQKGQHPPLQKESVFIGTMRLKKGGPGDKSFIRKGRNTLGTGAHECG